MFAVKSVEIVSGRMMGVHPHKRCDILLMLYNYQDYSNLAEDLKIYTMLNIYHLYLFETKVKDTIELLSLEAKVFDGVGDSTENHNRVENESGALLGGYASINWIINHQTYN